MCTGYVNMGGGCALGLMCVGGLMCSEGMAKGGIFPCDVGTFSLVVNIFRRDVRKTISLKASQKTCNHISSGGHVLDFFLRR